MEPEQAQTDTPQNVNRWNHVTPLSKYLAMVLFIAMPFIGGWIGYKSAPEKIVEVVKYVPEPAIPQPVTPSYVAPTTSLPNATSTQTSGSQSTSTASDKQLVMEMSTVKDTEEYNKLFTKYKKYTIREGGYQWKDGLVLFGFDEAGNAHPITYVDDVASSSNGLIYYTTIKPASDAPQVMSLVYDSKKDEVRKLVNAPLYQDKWFFDRKRMSPDTLYMVSIAKHEGDDGSFKTLYLINLTADTAQTIAMLTNNESFVKGLNEFTGTPEREIRWVDNTTIEASVYDPTKLIDATYGEEHPLLRKQLFKIQ